MKYTHLIAQYILEFRDMPLLHPAFVGYRQDHRRCLVRYREAKTPEILMRIHLLRSIYPPPERLAVQLRLLKHYHNLFSFTATISGLHRLITALI